MRNYCVARPPDGKVQRVGGGLELALGAPI
jgi:hypothetical protein